VNPGAANCGYAGEIDWSGDAIAVLPWSGYSPGFTPSYAVGDFNGDGLGDLAFGHAGYDTAYADVGRVWVFYGPLPATVDLDSASSADLVLAADGTYSTQVGGNLAFGDFDGDGADELLTSGVSDTSTTARTVTALLYEYASTGTGEVDYASAATALGTAYVGGANVWDVNGDGADDILVGGVLHWGGSGAANPFTASGSDVGASTSQSEPIDLNGDGYNDVVTSSGVYLGDPGVRWTPGNPDVVIASAFGLRDWNADGYSDVVTGAYGHAGPSYVNPYTGATVSQPNWGRADVHIGGPSGTAVMTFSVIGNEDYEFAGQQVTSAGDVDSDGFTEMWVMRTPAIDYRYYCRGYSSATLWYGGQSGTEDMSESTTVAQISAWWGGGNCTNNNQGWSVLPAGDTDGDAFDDQFVFRDIFSTSDASDYGFMGSVLPGQPR
jgi:hypothetical protein